MNYLPGEAAFVSVFNQNDIVAVIFVKQACTSLVKCNN